MTANTVPLRVLVFSSLDTLDTAITAVANQVQGVHLRIVPLEYTAIPLAPGDGQWDILIVNTDSPTHYQRIVANLPSTWVDILVVVAHYGAAPPSFQGVDAGRVYAYVPEYSPRAYWVLLFQHVLDRRSHTVFQYCAAARERFLVATSHSAAMRRFREDVANIPTLGRKVLMVCDSLTEEAVYLAQGAYVHMEAVDDVPGLVDGSCSDARALLCGDACGRVGMLTYPRSLIITHPLSLDADLQHEVGKLLRERFTDRRIIVLVGRDELASRKPARVQAGCLWRVLNNLSRLVIPSAVERPEEMIADQSGGVFLQERMDAYKRAVIVEMLRRTNGGVRETAILLGIPERTLRRYMDELDLHKESFRPRHDDPFR